MPDPDRLLNTLRKACAVLRGVPGRRGRLVQLPADAEVMATGDLHGNVENLRLLLQHADLGKQTRRHLVLQEVIHGPYRYPQGGDRSHQLLDLVAALACQFPGRVHFLPGNHEFSQTTNRRILKADEDLNGLFDQGIATAYGPRAVEVTAAYLELIAAAPVALRTANRVFLSHSLPTMRRLETFDVAVLERDVSTEADLLPGGAIHSLVWGRDTLPATVAAFLAKVDAELLITGHIPCERGYAVPNERQLILDSLGAPACYCVFPTDKTLTHAELVALVQTL